MNKIKLKRLARPISIVVVSILVLLIGFKIFYAQERIVNIADLAKNQQLVFDVDFKNKEAISNIKAPKVNLGGFFMQSTLDYEIDNITQNNNNIAYFVYPIDGLNSNTDYQFQISFKLESNLPKTQQMIIATSNVDQISQGPIKDDPTKYSTNIDATKLKGSNFYIQSGLHDYQTTIEATSNKAGNCYLLIGIKPDENDKIKFNIGNLKIKIIPEVNNDHSNKQSNN